VNSHIRLLHAVFELNIPTKEVNKVSMVFEQAYSGMNEPPTTAEKRYLFDTSQN
jgi:hypothetical protein